MIIYWKPKYLGSGLVNSYVASGAQGLSTTPPVIPTVTEVTGNAVDPIKLFNTESKRANVIYLGRKK